MAMGLEALSYEPRTVARRWEQAIAEKVQGFGGVMLQYTASPLMVAFGLPQTLDQLPQRAVQTALAIRQLVVEAQAAAGQEPVRQCGRRSIWAHCWSRGRRTNALCRLR